MDILLTDSDGFIVDDLDPLKKTYVADWHDKGPNEERDIDEWAEDRDKKGEKRHWGIKGLPGRPPKGTNKRVLKQYVAPKTWIDLLMEQGFVSPTIKQVTPDGKQMWFIENGIDYVADLGPQVHVQKAVFKPTLRQPSISYAPTQTNNKRGNKERNVQGEPYTGDVIDDDESMGL
tara:strand:- start:287 stop:811 length:525 start_codon:yes stop_codon:yes gene_type:complete